MICKHDGCDGNSMLFFNYCREHWYSHLWWNMRSRIECYADGCDKIIFGDDIGTGDYWRRYFCEKHFEDFMAHLEPGDRRKCVRFE